MTFNVMVASRDLYVSPRRINRSVYVRKIQRYILSEMQYVRVSTCCYCHNEKKTTIYELRRTQCSDVTLDGMVTSRCYWKLIYALFTNVI